eukprot:TRINITY_DN63254_c0_g2_i1.p1 TRINITY_DN63254_c0_g2~~TRINITY_DN63254_c0_g2_i1.p1  ORF type:complete len:151 (-),score=9.53 TRINITY_DN63254_c0_g2_i1:137-589(-)
MLMEMFKNSMRATVSRHQSHGMDLQPISVRICEGGDFVTIIILDRGGGIAKREREKIWSYGFTSVGKEEKEPKKEEAAMNLGGLFDGLTSPRHRTQSAMAGYGFGLPFCKVHAGYLGGDVSMHHIAYYGTVVHLRLRSVNSAKSVERLSL